MPQRSKGKPLESTDLDLGPGMGVVGRRAGERDTQVVLRAVAGSDAMRFCVLRRRRTVLIGRDPDSCALVLTDGSISREHCSVRYLLPDRLMVEDLGSTNGTKVNGAAFKGARPIEAGDELRVGNVPVRVERLTHTEIAELSAAWARLQDSQTDPLTGLNLRRYLDAVVPHQLAPLTCSGVPMALVVVDVDGLKQWNARGRAVGDALLRVLGRLVREEIRGEDRGVRYGGDELVALLPNCDEAGALGFAQRLIARVGDHDWSSVLAPRESGPPPSVSISAGAAEWSPEEGVHAWLARAARAVRVAKQLGGNQVVPASQVA